MALSGTRDENPYVNQQLVQQDVETLYRAGPQKIGTVSISWESERRLMRPGRNRRLRDPAFPIRSTPSGYRSGISASASTLAISDVSL